MTRPTHVQARFLCQINSPRWRGARRVAFSVVLALATLIASMVPAPPPTRAHTCTPEGEVTIDGTPLIPQGSGLARVTLADRRLRRLAVLPGGLVNAIARAPDGSKLALSRLFRPESDTAMGADLLITGPNGGQPLATIARERSGEVLGAPAWLADGRLVCHRQDIAGPAAGSRIERVDANGANRTSLVADAAEPTVAGATGQIAYIRKGADYDRIVARDLNGDGDERGLVDDARFLSLAFPRFSPNGEWLAFAAVGGPAGRLPVRPTTLFGFFGSTSRALAHGDPWDIWLVRADGSGLRRLTSFYDDDPAPAWSPDGRWIAVYSGEALHVVEVDGPGSHCIMGSGGYGGLEWVE